MEVKERILEHCRVLHPCFLVSPVSLEYRPYNVDILGGTVLHNCACIDALHEKSVVVALRLECIIHSVGFAKMHRATRKVWRHGAFC